MKAALRKEPKRVACIEMDKPVPAPDEVLIKVAYAGICGSDIHRVLEENDKWNSIVLGHEFSGWVEETGSDVGDLKKGDRVTAVPLEPCHVCDRCQQGQYSLCGGYSFVGSRKHGAFAEYVKVKASNVLLLPAGVTMKQGALLEPVTVSLHPVLQLGMLAGKKALIIGSGTIGVLAVPVLRLMGLKTIYVSDVVDEKLELARSCGADRTINVLNEPLAEVFEREGAPDIVLECSGTNAGKKDAIANCDGGGTIVLVGTSPNEMTIDAPLLERINRKELTIKGSWMNYSAPWPGKEWEIARFMMQKGMIDEQQIVSHIFPIERIQEAYDLIYRRDPFVKILIDMGADNE